MHPSILPNSHVIIRLPSGILKLLETTPNTICSLGKYGNFPVNLVLGRPFYYTFEIIEETEKDAICLRVVPASELNAEILAEDAAPSESRGEPTSQPDAASFDIVGEDGATLMKNNRLTVDDASRQTLSMQEIEELKKVGTGSGKEIIEKIMQSHANLDEKTAFSLAKYTLRKTRKYMRRFTVLPMNVSMLTEYILAEKEASRIMEIKEEALGLIGSWANVHYTAPKHLISSGEDSMPEIGRGRWLVVDETGGLMIALLAEKMGLLYGENQDDQGNGVLELPSMDKEGTNGDEDVSMQDANLDGEVQLEDSHADQDADVDNKDKKQTPAKRRLQPAQRHPTDLSSTNTIHLVHANAQPNISILKYFGYDSNNPSPTHPLHRHLKSLSWLQLLDPESDATYEEPETIPHSTLETWKSGKRGAYYKKRRRWERTRNIIEETRAGGFDGLVIASAMEPATILKHTVPLLRGAGHIVVYSPTVEPLTELTDLYSRDRKTAYLNQLQTEGLESLAEEDYPVDPRLLLAPTLITSKIRPWQVLPGRTHPMMTGRGGAEGYVFTARKVTPAEGKVEARGKFSKKRKIV